MLIFSLAFLVGAEPAAAPKRESYTMEITGDSKFSFSGICVSSDGAHEKKISGAVPAEIQIDTKIQKCVVKGEEPGKVLNIRLFHNRKLLLTRDDLPATAGVEIVIPLSSSKKR